MKLPQREDIAVTIRQREVRIRLKDWSVMAMGEGHLILQNDNPNDELYWKAISICIHDVEPTLHQIWRLYFEILAEIPGISQYLIQREPIEVGEEEIQIFKKFLKGTLKENHDFGQNLMMHLAENLNRTKQQWQYTLEFKPKSAIPDRYSKKFTDSIQQKTGIATTELLETLNTRPLCQKIRWFKKEISRKTKKNMNPLDVFGITPQRQPNIIQQLSKIHNLTGEMSIPNDRHGLLNQIILQQLKRSHILQNIARLQLLFTGPNEFTNPQLAQIWSGQQDKQAALARLKKGIMQVLNRNINTLDEISSLLSSSVLQQPTMPIDQDQQLLDMFKFLISLSWRDVSLFIRIKTNPENTSIEAIDFKFLDYQLKQSAKLKKTIAKDEKLLISYLQYLQTQ